MLKKTTSPLFWATLYSLLIITPLWANEGDPLYQRALTRMLAATYENWTFLQTTSEGDDVERAHFDGSKPEEKKWTLLSLNGKKPSKRQIKKFLKQKRREAKEEKESGADQEKGNAFLATLVQPGSLKLIKTTPEKAIYHFQPLMDEDEKEMEKYLFGEVIVNQSPPMIDQIRVYSKTTFPVKGAKIKMFDQNIQFALQQVEGDGKKPAFLSSIKVKVTGKAMGVFNFDETTSITFSDYAPSQGASATE